jgi:c-di-GMP-binding flagellar brake protein YcgR
MKVKDLKVNQLIEIEVNQDEKKEYLPSRIEEIDEKYIYISMPMSKGALLPMRLGEEIKIILRQKNGTFGFSSRIAGRKREPIPYLIIDKPERLASINQKREFVRLAVNLPVCFRIIDGDDKGPLEEGMTIDISAGGALFSTRADIKAGQKIELEIQLSDKESFFTPAHAIRVFEKDQHEKNAVRVAIEYDDINESQRDRIFRFIFEKQREWIKKGIL